MASMHRRWSARVRLPTGTGFAAPSSVAECMNWANPRGPVGPCMTVGNEMPDYTGPTDMVRDTDGILKNRPSTPMFYKSGGTPKPHTGRPAWTTYTETTAQDYGSYAPAPPTGRYMTTPKPCINTQRTPSRAIYENYLNDGQTYANDYNNTARFNNQEEALRDELLNQQLESYERQIEFERIKMLEEREKDLVNHSRMVGMPTGHLNQSVLRDALTEVSRQNPACIHTYDLRKGATITTKPPVIPRPPSGKTHYGKSGFHSRCQDSARGARPYSGTASRQVHDCNNYHNPHDVAFNGALTTKRVNFQTPVMSSRPGSAGYMRDSGKSGHLFQWRDSSNNPHLQRAAVTTPAAEQLWKMNRFKSAGSRIDNRWDADPYTMLTQTRPGLMTSDDLDKGKVKINVECKEGENMDVDVTVSKTPNTPLLRYL